MQKLTVGRIVHYVLPESHHNTGEIRPAIVVRAWCDTCAQLQVFLDPVNDEPLDPNEQSSVSLSEEKAPRTWHWPARG